MRPEHGTRMTLMLGGYCSRLTPARSAAPYVHQLQKNAVIFGSQSFMLFSSLFTTRRDAPRERKTVHVFVPGPGARRSIPRKRHTGLLVAVFLSLHFVDHGDDLAGLEPSQVDGT